VVVDGLTAWTLELHKSLLVWLRPFELRLMEEADTFCSRSIPIVCLCYITFFPRVCHSSETGGGKISTFLFGYGRWEHTYNAQKHEMVSILQVSILQGSSGIIHITLDSWTAPNDIQFLDVIAHFLSHDDRIDHLVLGLREIEGTPNGVNLRSLLVRILTEYDIWPKIGYFMTSQHRRHLGAGGLNLAALGCSVTTSTHQ